VLHKKAKKEPINATRESVKQEMAKPRFSRSARIAEEALDTARIPERPSTSMPGTVEKIIPARPPNEPEKVQILLSGFEKHYRNLRFENTLTDEHGDEVSLKKGAHVEITIAAKKNQP
jgi:hypothetical protein